MAYKFPSAEWIQAFQDKLNTDQKYAKVATKWEGDFVFQIEADGRLAKTVYYYTDLWHGKCLEAFMFDEERLTDLKPAFVLSAPYSNFVLVLKGELDPMQAMITRKLKVQGSMAYMMRNVPVVLDFMRCVREIETEFLE